MITLIKLKDFKGKIKNKKGEGYIDTAVKFLIAIALVVFAVNVFTMFKTYRDLDIMSKEILEVATYYGTTDTNNEKVKHAIEVYQKETGLTTTDVKITTEDGGYAEGSNTNVQLGKTITVIVSDDHPIIGFGVFSDVVSIPMSTHHTGLSEVYWK